MKREARNITCVWDFSPIISSKCNDSGGVYCGLVTVRPASTRHENADSLLLSSQHSASQVIRGANHLELSTYITIARSCLVASAIRCIWVKSLVTPAALLGQKSSLPIRLVDPCKERSSGGILCSQSYIFLRLPKKAFRVS